LVGSWRLLVTGFMIRRVYWQGEVCGIKCRDTAWSGRIGSKMPSEPTPAPSITLMSVVVVALAGNNLVVRPLLFTNPSSLEAPPVGSHAEEVIGPLVPETCV
jgi:hypothetical protein